MITEKFFLRNPSNINACITMHVIFLQSGEALSSETDPLKTHSFLLLFILIMVNNMLIEEYT